MYRDCTKKIKIGDRVIGGGSTVTRQPQTQADHYPLCGVKRGGKSLCQYWGTPL